MQLKSDGFTRSLKSFCMTLIWITGLLLAGSDSDSMPWINLIGLVLFLCASLLLGRSLHQTGKTGSNAAYSGVKAGTRLEKGAANKRIRCRQQGRFVLGT